MGVSDGGPAEMIFMEYLFIGHLKLGVGAVTRNYCSISQEHSEAQTTCEGLQGDRGIRDGT